MHLTLVGLGNIGSHAAPLLARMPAVTRLTLIDRDRYETANLQAQAILPHDAGKSKALVQARRLRGQRPDLLVDAIQADVETLPLGRLRCDMVLAAVDSRRTRQYLNEACWSLGIPWVDSGVESAGGLIRIAGFEPGAKNACLECSWDERHYASLEVEFPCREQAAHPRTNAAASLGGAAGALLAIECGKLFGKGPGEPVIGREIVLDTQWHKQHVSCLSRNAQCRFDHRMPAAQPSDSALVTTTVGEVLAVGEMTDAALSVAGTRGFVRRAVCRHCGYGLKSLKLLRGLKCGKCGKRMDVAGFDTISQLKRTDLAKTELTGPLARLGIQAGDILTLTGRDGERSLEVHDA